MNPIVFYPFFQFLLSTTTIAQTPITRIGDSCPSALTAPEITANPFNPHHQLNNPLSKGKAAIVPSGITKLETIANNPAASQTGRPSPGRGGSVPVVGIDRGGTV